MNRRSLFLLILVVASHLVGRAQSSIFGEDTSITPKKGLIMMVNGGVDLPAADMAKRFGTSFRIGPSLAYKTRSNWLFGFKFDFITGNKTKEDSLMVNIKDRYSGKFNGRTMEFLNDGGQRTNVYIYERGYLAGLYVGKIFNFDELRPDNGLIVIATVGFIQHKINIFNSEGDIPQLRGAYKKGYDRLTNGIFIEQFIGYNVISRKGFLNFNFGLDFMEGFTQGRRTYLYDVRRADNKNRLDVLMGIRGTWMIPLFKKKSEELTF